MNKHTLESRIAINANGCWIYMGREGRGTKPYPSCTVTVAGSARTIRIHRWVYENYVAPIPDGLVTLHACDNPHCVNPGHLSLGTNADNTADMVSKGRQRGNPGERNRHAKLTAEQVAAIRHDPRKVRLIAAEYGVTRTNIHDIRRGDTWAGVGEQRTDLRYGNEKLTPDQVRAIRAGTDSCKITGATFDVSPQTINNIRRRLCYADVV